MTVKPIIFSGPMIRALLEGRKSQTRRILKPQPQANVDSWDWTWPIPRKGVTPGSVICWRADRKPDLWPYLPYAPGDLLYVRESLYRNREPDERDEEHRGIYYIRYRADDTINGLWCPLMILGGFNKQPRGYSVPSIHMPRAWSRLTLEVVSVKVERLQDISKEDAIAEAPITEFTLGQARRDQILEWDNFGDLPDETPLYVTNWGTPDGDPYTLSQFARDGFRRLWDDLNAKRAPWDSNPWIVAATFTVHKQNVDALMAQRETT